MTEPRPAPYPADTRAKGWRFELDYERIEQSSTWALAGPEGRPWLLMMWLVSWRQTPAGSFPNEDDVIVALIGIPERTWAKHRKVLMRGWWLADDGRLYHDTIASRVRAMLDKKTDAKVRKAEYRARMDAVRTGASVPELSHGTDAGHGGDERGKDNTGTRTGTRTYTQEDKPLGEARKRATRKCPKEFELTAEARQWAAQNAPLVNPESELAKLKDHTFKTSHSDWDGALRNWLRRAQEDAEQRRGVASAEPAWRTEQRERNAAFAGPAAAKRPGQGVAEIIDMESGNAAARRLG